MIKGLDIKIYGGTFITNINRYVIKLGDEVSVSEGEYVVVPGFAKKPKLRFDVLDDSGIIEVKGNKLIAKKVGYSSIGILNNNRVLRKATIMVVNPRINNIEVKLDNTVKYFGDKAKILSSVEIDDFKKLEKGYKFSYSTNKPDILKVSGDTVEAIGIGEATLISKYDRNEAQTIINVLPRVDKIKVDKYYEIEVGETLNIKPEIFTNPSHSKVSVHYKPMNNVDQGKYDDNDIILIGDEGPYTNHGILIDKSGNIKGNRVGTYKLKISSGNKKVFTAIGVKPQSFENIPIENLNYFVKSKKDKLIDLELGWDAKENINSYRIYLEKEGEEPELLSTVKYNTRIKDRISTVVSLNTDKIDTTKFSIYVRGNNAISETKKSNSIILSDNIDTSFQNKKVSGIEYEIDSSNNKLNIKWSPIDKSKYTYRIYSKNPKVLNAPYKLVSTNITKNSKSLSTEVNNINQEYYILAVNSNGQVSSFSEPIKINYFFNE